MILNSNILLNIFFEYFNQKIILSKNFSKPMFLFLAKILCSAAYCPTVIQTYGNPHQLQCINSINSNVRSVPIQNKSFSKYYSETMYKPKIIYSDLNKISSQSAAITTESIYFTCLQCKCLIDIALEYKNIHSFSFFPTLVCCYNCFHYYFVEDSKNSNVQNSLFAYRMINIGQVNQIQFSNSYPKENYSDRFTINDSIYIKDNSYKTNVFLLKRELFPAYCIKCRSIIYIILSPGERFCDKERSINVNCKCDYTTQLFLYNDISETSKNLCLNKTNNTFIQTSFPSNYVNQNTYLENNNNQNIIHQNIHDTAQTSNYSIWQNFQSSNFLQNTKDFQNYSQHLRDNIQFQVVNPCFIQENNINPRLEHNLFVQHNHHDLNHNKFQDSKKYPQSYPETSEVKREQFF